MILLLICFVSFMLSFVLFEVVGFIIIIIKGLFLFIFNFIFFIFYKIDLII